MDTGSDVLSSLLSDPAKLSAAIGAVSSMLGDAPGDKPHADGGGQFRLTGRHSEAAELIRALKPFLSDERREKADRALRLITVAALASEFKI